MCVIVANIVGGAEDVDLLPSGVALITSGLQYQHLKTKDVGEIYSMNMRKVNEQFDTSGKAPMAQKVKIQTSASFGTSEVMNFKPHGISTLVEDGNTYVYIVNHGPDGDSIESFLFDEQANALHHRKTIRDELLFRVNDLTLVSIDQFFATNDQYFNNPTLSLLEMILMLDWGTLVYYDGKEATVVDSKLSGPNGIAIDKKRHFLYLSLASEEVIRVYKLDPKSRKIERHKDIAVFTTSDNLWIDHTNGDVWAGCHPVMHELITSFMNLEKKRCPSQVLKIEMKNNHNDWSITEPYSDDGTHLSGSSVSVRFQNSILIGTVFDRLMFCKLISEILL